MSGKAADVKSTELAKITWWYVVRDYATDERAEAMFHRVFASFEPGKTWIAGYRILDELGKPRRVVMLGHVEHTVREAARIMGGLPYDMSEEEVIGLVARRIRVLAQVEKDKLPPWLYLAHHKGGMRIHPDGTVEEVEQ